ncbi:MAG: hypothetical protein HFG33_00025 [Bacilli bacterium]|nr:hypothetical protein [Bacilli bacterium]
MKKNFRKERVKMNDKFSELILLLQTNLKKKSEEKDELLSKKRKISSNLRGVKNELSEKELNASLLRSNLKKYNRYYLTLIKSIVHIILNVFSESMVVGLYVLVCLVVFDNLFKGPLKLLLSIIIMAGATFACCDTFKNLIASQKGCIEDIKESRQTRKKYKSNKDIIKELDILSAHMEGLTSALDKLTEKETLLDSNLERVSSEIDKLKQKLNITSDAFIQSSLKVQGVHIEEDLDQEYDQSHIEEELRSIDEGRRLDFKPIQGDNQ